ncbi:MAG TPA: SDR family NAD(P)-dependent oxidoreductase, partial [Acidimicrobiia bacterium]|nr:SDR family NAD(P)-dependent oxidoreductase [Acidimicrobiia bacterium]
MGSALAGKAALVTGASKGIGLGMARAFAREGAAVMISSRKQDALDAAAAGIVAELPDAHVTTFAANAGEPDQAEACVGATIERLGGIDILVNNAGTNPVMGPTIDADLDAWDKT